VTDSKRLLAWYDRNRRELPWRRSPPDPYRTLVSEFMLQQTRVETVLSYYDRFLARFPSPETLAASPESDVLVHWSGLGYYRRARQLHQAAKAIQERGAFPTTEKELLELPGIGSYTAAAVASIAFGARTAVLDGNVIRVQSRRLGVRETHGAAARRRLRAAAERLLDPQRPGDSNQAMMELGATVCTLRRPRCEICPLRAGCRAAERGRPGDYPRARVRRASEDLRLVAVLARDRHRRLLVVRRPPDATLLAGSWELPWVPQADRESCQRALGERYGGSWFLREARAEVRHSITHRRLRVELRDGGLDAGESVGEGVEARWVSEAELLALPRSSLVDKLLRRAGA
jgi:A/G-specific adenine glycosylase